MMQDRQDNEILQRAVLSLRNAPVPQGPPDAVIEAILNADHAGGGTKRAIFRGRWLLKAAAAVVIIAGCALSAWLVLGAHGVTVAYADVRARILNAKAMSFKVSVTFKDAQPETSRVSILEGGHMRLVGKIKGKDVTAIADFSKGKILIWRDQDDKKAYMIDLVGVNKSAYSENWLEHLQKSLGDWAEDLGEKDIAGRRAKGFRTRNGEFAATLWVDAKTKDLLLAENESPESKAVLTDFQMDPKLEPGFFDLKAPEGYAVENKTYDVWAAASQATTKLLEIEGLPKDVQQSVAEAVSKVLGDAMAGVKKAAESPAGQRINALVLLPPDDGFPGLIEFLGDKDENVGLYAADVSMGYARRYRNKAVQYLAKALESQNDRVVQNVLIIIGCEPEPLKGLAPNVRSVVMHSKDPSRCSGGVLTLSSIRDSEGLAQIAKDHPEQKVRTMATRQLQHLKEQQTQPASRPSVTATRSDTQPTSWPAAPAN